MLEIFISPTMSVQAERLGNKLWILLSPFTVRVNDELITVPKGFVFDGNSSPRLFWTLCSPVGGAFGEAGLIHDYLYSLDSKDDFSRKQADQIHKAIGLYRGSRKSRAYAIYQTLRIFGKKSYKQQESHEKIRTCIVYNFFYAQVRSLELSK